MPGKTAFAHRLLVLIHGCATYTMLADGVHQEALYTDTYQKR